MIRATLIAAAAAADARPVQPARACRGRACLRGSTMTVRKVHGCLAVLVVLGAFAASGAQAAAYIPEGSWAGYTAQVASGHFTAVAASWIEPTTSCTKQRSEASFWIGLGGSGNTSFYGPLQDGTDADCVGDATRDFAWYEAFPDGPVTIRHFQIHPGDSVSSTIVTTPYRATFRLRDNTTGRSYTHHLSLRLHPAATQTAEWVVEGPYSAAPVWLLGAFTPVTFTAASATASGHTGTISDPAWQLYPEQIIDAISGSVAPSLLDAAGDSFTLTTDSLTVAP